MLSLPDRLYNLPLVEFTSTAVVVLAKRRNNETSVTTSSAGIRAVRHVPRTQSRHFVFFFFNEMLFQTMDSCLRVSVVRAFPTYGPLRALTESAHDSARPNEVAMLPDLPIRS